TNFMADVVVDVIQRHAGLSGLYQVTAPPISKHDLLVRLRDAFSLDVTIEPDEEVISDRSMIGAKFLEATGREYPTWDSLIDALASDETPYEAWR
ncbi:MAG: SDR family NAD(P)-dependent oxidoreductase, partial [Deltaproteobacteria bacterium]|nr:SDR family NAD(P)-dependent oxidoreductase [Deltaproteobacteria bacterium]